MSDHSSGYGRELSEDEVAADAHRDFVGGRWQEIGRLQFDFLVARGLRPRDILVDIGCGPLRGGIHFIHYLEPGHYYGIDRNASLLEAGLRLELSAAAVGPEGQAIDLRGRIPPGHLLHSTRFEFERLGVRADYALAQSVFTHVPLNSVRLCLANLAPWMKPGASFYASYFRCEDGHPVAQSLEHSGGAIQTWGDRDPYHYSVDDMRHCARGLGWGLEPLGEWGHPAGQEMLRFSRC